MSYINHITISLLASPLQSSPNFPLFQFHLSLYSMAGPVAGNQIARRVIDDLIDFSRETSVPRNMKFFFEQQIFERRHFINRMCEEVQTSRNLLAQLTALIAELEASADPGEADEQIETKEEHVHVMEAEANDGRVYHPAPVVLGIVCGCYHLEFGEADVKTGGISAMKAYDCYFFIPSSIKSPS
ncbi:hypothetical protein Tco_1545418 [Tanacetum coccineum]